MSEDHSDQPLNGTSREPAAGPTAVLEPEVCEFLTDFAHAGQTSIMDAMSKLPAGTQHMPIFVIMKVLAELCHVYWPKVGPRIWDDGITEAVQRMAQFLILSPEALARWKLDAETRLAQSRDELGDAPVIILPAGARRN